MSESESSFVDSRSEMSEAPICTKNDKKNTLKKSLQDLIDAKKTIQNNHGKDQKEIRLISNDFHELAELLDSAIDEIKTKKAVESAIENLDFISDQLKTFTSNLQNINNQKVESKWEDFEAKFAQFQEDFASVKAFSLLGVAKFGKPNKPREERACRRCHQNMNPRKLPGNFHTPLECPQTGYNRVYPPKRERGFVILKDLSKK